ncbi:MAG: TonB-dependent receptor [Bacteroidota bacterium]
MKQILLLLTITIISAQVFAQPTKSTITVTVLTENKLPVDAATVSLLRSKDSGLVKIALSNKDGMADFENIDAGNYLVRITAVGNSEKYSEPIFITGQQPLFALPAITLSPRAAAEMQSVTIMAKKPFIQKLSDRIVVNVESSIAGAGSSALDILEMSPGVTVDQNDAVSLRGRAGVIIMVDGKPSPLNAADLANYLRSLPSNAIERIDIITNPSSKYDAAGNSGIIDIRMKKNQQLGTNGTINAGAGQGRYSKANAGATLNYRNNKMNVFGNHNYAYRKNFNHLIINRNFFEDGIFKGSDDKNNYSTTPVQSHNVRAGIDFFPSKTAIIGFVVNSNFFGFTRFADIKTVVNNLQNTPAFSFRSFGTNNDDFRNAVANINYKQTLDSTGKELTADVDYGEFTSSSLTNTSSYFYNLNGTKRRADDILDGNQQRLLKLHTAKVDYAHPMNKTAKLELGAKTSYVTADNDARFFNVFATGTVVDAGKTNRFLYNEWNNALYANFSKEYKKFNVQLGLRGELTNLKTHQVKDNADYNNEYFQLFPSTFFNYKLTPDKTIGASVSRRINRPGYNDLNPFLFQIDASIYSTGNPFLKPQTTWSYEMNYTLKQMNFSLSYSHTNNPFSSVLAKILDVIPTFEIGPGQDSNITVQTIVNLQSSNYMGFTASLPVRINKWWNTVSNLNVFRNSFNGSIGGAVLDDGAIAANLRINNSFTLKKGWSAELNANGQTGGRYGYMVLKPLLNVDAGVQKTIMKGQGTLRLNATDIFWTGRPKATVNYPGSYLENWHAYRDSRTINFSISYRFGSNKIQASRRRTTASEEEKQRAG